MKREVTVHYSRTINTGNYSSQRIDVGVTRELAVTEVYDDVLKSEYAFVKKFVNSKIKNILEGLEK